MTWRNLDANEQDYIKNLMYQNIKQKHDNIFAIICFVTGLMFFIMMQLYLKYIIAMIWILLIIIFIWKISSIFLDNLCKLRYKRIDWSQYKAQDCKVLSKYTDESCLDRDDNNYAETNKLQIEIKHENNTENVTLRLQWFLSYHIHENDFVRVIKDKRNNKYYIAGMSKINATTQSE